MSTPSDLADRLRNTHLISTMLTASDVADRLRTTHLASVTGEADRASRSHNLTFEFPAVDLLPVPGSTPYFERPANIEQRRRPQETSLHDAVGTEFFAVLGADDAGIAAPTSTYDGCKRLMDAVHSRYGQDGSSRLRMVSYTEGEHGEHYPIPLHRLQLQAYSRNSNVPIIVYEGELDDDEWGRMTMYVENYEWINVLQNLVSRGSERAWFEVRHRLARVHDDDLTASVEEARWEDEWATDPPQSVEELFATQLEPVTAQDERNLSLLGDGIVHVELPCGHRIHVRKIEISALTAEACLNQTCPVCGRRIMQVVDDDELTFRREFDRADAYRATDYTWQDLDKKIRKSARSLEVHTETLLQALRASLDSFAAPRSVCPASLCPTNSLETVLVMETFRNSYGGLDITTTMSPSDLLECFHGLAVGTKTGKGEHESLATAVTPPGWPGFLELWLTRAVNFLVERRCWDGSSFLHEGLHEHFAGLHYNVSGDGNGAEQNQQMQDIETGMEHTTLKE